MTTILPPLSKRPGRASRGTRPAPEPDQPDRELARALDRARALSWDSFGRTLDFFLPGMFVLNGETGLYPAASITGDECQLQCDHCRGRLLPPMIAASSPEMLVQKALDLEKRGRLGLLVSGGSDHQGRLPWDRFYPALEEIARRTSLIITVHSGCLDRATARRLKDCGVSQALVDVIGDDDTARKICHLDQGSAPLWATLEHLLEVGLEVAPHIVLGLNQGRIQGEYQALERLGQFTLKRLVTVVLNPFSGTPLAKVTPPSPEEASRFLIAAREVLPLARHHLGCARPRGPHRWRLDRLAILAGVNALALPSDEAWNQAEALGLETKFFQNLLFFGRRGPNFLPSPRLTVRRIIWRNRPWKVPNMCASPWPRP